MKPCDYYQCGTTLALVLMLAQKCASIRCMQCHHHSTSDHHNGEADKVRQQTRRCLDGRLAPRECPSSKHTHCITSVEMRLWQLDDGRLQVRHRRVTWRKCGTRHDISNCTDYKFADDKAPGGLETLRMCDYGCDQDDCYVATGHRRTTDYRWIIGTAAIVSICRIGVR